MPYLVKRDLTTHIYPEIIREIIRDYVVTYDEKVEFPDEGITGKQYRAMDEGKYYEWTGEGYEEIQPFDLVAMAIEAAMGEVKSYLNRFDLLAMFGDANTAPTYENIFLKNITKDIACWHLIKLANPNINLELFRTAYEDAIKYLEKVQNGKVDPGFPVRTDDEETPFDEGGNIGWSSNTKRNNHY